MTHDVMFVDFLPRIDSEFLLTKSPRYQRDQVLSHRGLLYSIHWMKIHDFHNEYLIHLRVHVPLRQSYS